MGAYRPKADSLAAVLFGKTRRAVLSLLMGHPEDSFYLREIARWAECGLGSVQRELRRLERAGIILRLARGHQVFFQANRRCPVFKELRGITTKTAGLADVLGDVLRPLAGRIRVAFVYGSVARGEETDASDVDICVVGTVALGEIVTALSTAQDRLSRELNPVVYPPEEFSAKLAAGHQFVSSLADSPKVFLIGDECELAGLAEKRMAHRAPSKPAGSRRSARRRRT